MKVSFSREVAYTPTWKGNNELPEEEQCKATLKPLEMEDLIKLMDSLQSASGGSVDPEALVATEGTQQIAQVKELISACGHLIPKYTKIEGLSDESGTVTSDDIVKFPYYMELTAELLTELGSISMPNEVEEKNL